MSLSLGSSSRYGLTTVVLKLVGLLGSYTLHVSFLRLINLNRPVHLPLWPVLPSRHTRTSKLSGRLWIALTDRLFWWFSTLLTCLLALILATSSIAFQTTIAHYVIDSASGSSLLI